MQINPQSTRIGWIGTGVMGGSMCRRLIEAGYSATVYNRTAAKTAPLVELGATAVDGPAAVAAASDVVFSIVGTPEDVRSVLLADDGALSEMASGNVLVDMTTSQPALAVEIAEAAAPQGVMAIDAPVSGGDIGARNGTLSIMIGGDEQAVNDLAPLWEIMGKTWVRQGGPGAGQHTKMVNQTLVAGIMISVCEALIYAHRAGLDLETVLQSVAPGAAGSWTLSNLGPRMIAGNFEPGFFIEHFLKDMGIALEEAERMGLQMPGLELAKELYDRAAEEGHAKDGTHALVKALSRMSGFEWGQS